MAIETVPQADTGLPNDEGGYLPASVKTCAKSALRQEIARRACYEVQQLAKMLHEYIEKNDSSGQDAPAMRSGLMRLSDLSDIIYEAAITDQPSDTDADLIEMFGGRLALGKFAEGDAA